ncbi:MAG: heme exporter protein CcmD [Rhodobacterales bacterium]|nr:heme exporter protein CcmD [Rhodobacterales bacterium]
MSLLGAYALYVLSAYAVSLVLLAGLVWLSWRRAERVRAALARVEGVRADG